jgi:hypothetical protein
MTGCIRRHVASFSSSIAARIEQLLEKARERLQREAHRRITAAALIALFDEERTLKRLVEHHHEREETALFAKVFKAHTARSLA